MQTLDNAMSQNASTLMLRVLAETSFCKDLTDDEITAFRKYTSIQKVDSNDVVYREGEIANGFHILIDGQVSIWRKPSTGQNVRINTVYQGETFGEMSMVDRLHRSATVIADKKCMMVFVDKAALDALAHEHPYIAYKIMQGIACTISMRLRKVAPD
jgi:CRP-like cAMP-binding protein